MRAEDEVKLHDEYHADRVERHGLENMSAWELVGALKQRLYEDTTVRDDFVDVAVIALFERIEQDLEEVL